MVETEETFFFIPHTHWEGAVFKTREEYLEIGLPNILRALHLLDEYPDYKFVLDQVCYVKPFLERFPEHEENFKKYVDEGRLAIVGGTDVMLDVNMPGGESYIRQVLYGKKYYRQKLGVDVKVGWQLDTFGHHAQMPQLLKLAGYTSFWFFRGVPDWNTPAEFLWEGLDGSQIPAFWLPLGYAVTYSSPKTFTEFTSFFNQQYELLTPFSRGPHRVGLAGADVCEPETHVPSLVREYNHQKNKPFSIKISIPTEYEAVVEERTIGRPVIKTELNPIFQGSYSSRIELKQRTRELERLLIDTEKVGVILHTMGETISSNSLWDAWEPILFNQAHDLMSGVMTDRVYEDTLRGYDFSKRIIDSELESRLERMIAYIETSGEGTAIVVFNSLGWPRTDVVFVNVGFIERDVMDLVLTDPDNEILPIQIVNSEKYNNGAILQARIAFIACNIPAMGYSIFHLLKQGIQEGVNASRAPQIHHSLENEFYSMEVDPASGAITSLVAKEGNWPVLSGNGNVLVMEEDRGDFWELYRPLDGGSRIAMRDRHEPPSKDHAFFSTDQSGDSGCIILGPVFSEFSVEHPFSGQGNFKTVVRLYAGLRRIDISTKILNNDQFVRYRVLFQTTIHQGQIIHEIPFGAIERPDGIEFPSQNWIDINDGHKGVALLNRGLPGNNIANGTMLLSLMRSTSIVAYGYSGGYEPGMTSKSGLELGKELCFDYALMPHMGNWEQAGVYRAALEYNHPMLAHTASAHPGRLPSRWSFLQISHPNIVVSALKMGEDGRGVVLRIYEASGHTVDNVKINMNDEIVAAQESNLLEDSGETIRIANKTINLNFHPFEIKTLKLLLKTTAQ